MCLGTFQRLRRSLAISSVYAAVRILPEAFYIIGNAISYYIKKHRQTDSAPHFLQLAAILQALQLCVPDFHLVCRFPYDRLLMQKTDFIILQHSTVHKKNITILTPENKKEQPIYILELFFYFRSPRSIGITVSCSFVLRSFHIPKTSFCFSVRFSELPS